MSSHKNIRCGPCEKGKVNGKADIWCYDCGEGLCSSCVSHHERFKLAHDHKIIDIQAFKPPFGSYQTKCETHGQQLRLYCQTHLMPCCDECISQSHLKCTGIKSLASKVEKTNIEKLRVSAEKNINSTLNFLGKLANNKSENINRGEQQYRGIKQSISKIRMEINKNLDNLERTICKDADTVWGQEKSKVTGFIREIEVKQKSLKEMKDRLYTFTKPASTLQSFLGINQINQEMHQCQLYFEEQNEAIRDVDIKLKQNDEIKQILSKVQSLMSFGEITLGKETSIKRKPIVELQEQPNIKNMVMNIESEKQINLKSITSISDLIHLMDGRVIIVEQYGKVHILSSDYKDQKRLTTSDGAWSVTEMKQDTIAVTYPLEKTIIMFDLKTKTHFKVITLEKSCWGLYFSNNTLFVGLARDEIRIIDLGGKTLKSIGFSMHEKLQLCHLLYCNDRVIFSDYHGKAVTCIDGSGKQIWRYKQNLSGPKGLCFDTYGNIIVADCISEKIIVISKDGQDSKVLLTKEDGLEMPGFISFNKSSGFICHDLGMNFTKVHLFYK